MQTIIDLYGDEYPVIGIFANEWAIVSELDIQKSLIWSAIHLYSKQAATIVVRANKTSIIAVKKLQSPDVYHNWNHKRSL